MKIKNNKTVLGIITDLEDLNKKALSALISVCENYGGNVDIDSDTAIDFDLGFSGCEMCNIDNLFISPKGTLCAKVSTCDFGEEHDVEILESDAIEILKIIISDAGDLECSL